MPNSVSKASWEGDSKGISQKWVLSQVSLNWIGELWVKNCYLAHWMTWGICDSSNLSLAPSSQRTPLTSAHSLCWSGRTWCKPSLVTYSIFCEIFTIRDHCKMCSLENIHSRFSSWMWTFHSLFRLNLGAMIFARLLWPNGWKDFKSRCLVTIPCQS